MTFFSRIADERWSQDLVMGVDLRYGASSYRFRRTDDLARNGGATSSRFLRLNGQMGTKFNASLSQQCELYSETTGSDQYVNGDWTIAVRARSTETSGNVAGFNNLWSSTTNVNNYLRYTGDGMAYLSMSPTAWRPGWTPKRAIDKWNTYIGRCSLNHTNPLPTILANEVWQNDWQGASSASGSPAGYMSTTYYVGYSGTTTGYYNGEVEWIGIWNRWITDSEIGALSSGISPFAPISRALYFPGFAVPAAGGGGTVVTSLAGEGGLAGAGGLAGPGGGLAG